MTDSPVSSNPFEITVKGDASCIKEFFSGFNAVVATQIRPQVILAEAINDLVPALSDFLRIKAGAHVHCAESAGSTAAKSADGAPESAATGGFAGMMDQFKNMFTGVTGQAKPAEDGAAVTGETSAPASKTSELFDLKVDVDLSKGKEEQTRYSITYNGKSRDILEEDHRQLDEFQKLIGLLNNTPAPVVTKLEALVESHTGNVEGLIKAIPESGLSEVEQDMLKRATVLSAGAGQELKSVTLHMFLAGKLPTVVSKLATKFGAVSGMAVDGSRPAFSEVSPAGSSTIPGNIMGQLPNLLEGVFGAFGNMAGGQGLGSAPGAAASSGSSKATSSANTNRGSGGSVRRLLKRGGGSGGKR